MTAKDLGETLAVIADKAKALRDAGVVGRVTVDGVSFEVGELVAREATGAAPATNENEAPANVLDDPDLYGGFVPQRRAAPTFPQSSPNDDDDD